MDHGLLAGAIAKAILPGDDPGGMIVTMLIGIAGAIIGGLIASALNLGDLGDFSTSAPGSSPSSARCSS